MKIVQPNEVHNQFRADLLEVLRKHGGQLSAMEMLALAAHATGQILALQDQRTVTGEMAMEVVTQNIHQGNREAIDRLTRTRGSA